MLIGKYNKSLIIIYLGVLFAVLGMYFDGATGFYAALPKYNDIPQLNKVYQLIKKNQEAISK